MTDGSPSPLPRVLLVGGLDPTGGAGLAADVRMSSALGVHPAVVVTCLTVQNRHGFRSSEPVEDRVARESLQAVFEDGPVQAIKVGMAGSPRLLELVLGTCQSHAAGVPVVVDPVLSATAGGMSSGDDLVDAYLALLPQITTLTPNLPELARLAPTGVETLIAGGARFVVVKGGHSEPAPDGLIEDQLVSVEGVVTVRHLRLDRGPIHGTGCAFASALASRLARSEGMESAFRGAVADLETSIRRTPWSSDGLAVPLVISASRNQA